MTAGADGLEELLDGWRTLSQWSAEPGNRPGRRTWNALVDRLAALEEQALRHADGHAALVTVAASDDDPFVRDQARRALDPGVPDDGPARERWARHPLVGLADLALRWRAGLLLLPARTAVAFGASDDSSRLLGVPTGPLDAWPRRTDGTPLVLVLDVDLAALTAFGDIGLDGVLGLPPTGRLQVFHDLESWGLDPADAAAGAWLVRHVPAPDGPAQPPDDLDAQGRQPAHQVRLTPFTAVAPAAPLTPTMADAFERAERRLVDATRRQAEMHGPDGGAPAEPPSDTDLDRDPALGRPARLLGLAQLPEDDARSLLRLARPSVRDWQLLAAVPGVGPFEGVFGDLGQLEVWCPAADLAAGRLDTAWCLVRA